MRVAIAASSLALRVGLREVLNGLPDVRVVAVASRAEELPWQEVDLLVLAAPKELVALADSAETLPPLLLLGDEPGEVQMLPALHGPAWGLLPLNASEMELEAALRAVEQGLWVGAPALLGGLLREADSLNAADSAPLPDPLTGREIEVLQMMAQGLANKQIGLALGISEHTVKFHLSSLYAKLGVASRTEAVRAGARRGLVGL
ncbi:MAG: response regulator transcription factor [Anaerolineales bacterium]